MGLLVDEVSAKLTGIEHEGRLDFICRVVSIDVLGIPNLALTSTPDMESRH